MHSATRGARRLLRTTGLVALATGAFVALPAVAQAAAPAVTTGGASKIGPGSATLSSSVNAKGKATVFFFQIGTTKTYGVNTAETAAGAGTKALAHASSVVGLAPAQTYHYRAVARNADGTTVGADKSFKTQNQPLGFSLAATPNPVDFGDPVTLQGVLSGTLNSGKKVALQQNVFPFTTGFQTVGNPQVTGSTGAFSFPLLSVVTNTQYRVVTSANAKVVSSVVTLGVAVKVSTSIGTRSVKRNHRIRFSGKITPAKVGSLYAIQRLNSKGKWEVVAGGTSHAGGSTYSTFNTKAKIKKSGTYRVFVGVADGYQVSGIGNSKKISIKK